MIKSAPVSKTSAQMARWINAPNAVVTTASQHASEAALHILSQDGNAIDAAIAAAFVLSVCEPSGSGIGGQTSLMIHLANGKTVYLDGHSFAPAAVSLQRVAAKQQRFGFRACTVPSTVATLEQARVRFGVLGMDSVLEPAIRLAHDGFFVTDLQQRQAKWCLNDLGTPGRKPRILRINRWLNDTRLRQPTLCKTLQRMAKYGAQDFYHGALADDIATDMAQNQGLLTAKDLASTRLPVSRKPISITYRGYEVVSTPPPGGGLQLLLALKILERLYEPESHTDMCDWYEAVALAVFAAFEEREKFSIHPDDFTTSIKNWVLSDARSDEIACKLALQQHLPVVAADDEEPGETTHLCVADKHGNTVSLTQSIQSLFGANVANWKLGFLYNNYLVTCPRYRHPYQLGRQCLPRSNAAPTLVFRDGKLLMALGAAGSRRIISSILQVISRTIDLKMPVAKAMAAPRVHALLDGKVWLEKPAANKKTVHKLSNLFDKVELRSKHSFVMGGAQAISITESGKHAAADPRRDGQAGGW
ncbi:MAG: gamma-glutamyltransferase [bacterium]